MMLQLKNAALSLPCGRTAEATGSIFWGSTVLVGCDGDVAGFCGCCCGCCCCGAEGVWHVSLTTSDVGLSLQSWTIREAFNVHEKQKMEGEHFRNSVERTDWELLTSVSQNWKPSGLESITPVGKYDTKNRKLEGFLFFLSCVSRNEFSGSWCNSRFYFACFHTKSWIMGLWTRQKKKKISELCKRGNNCESNN